MVTRTFGFIVTVVALAAVTMACSAETDQPSAGPATASPTPAGDPRDSGELDSLQDLGISEQMREYGPEVSRCLRDLGWEVEDSDGGFGVTVDEEQWPQYRADRRDCEERLGYDDPAPPSVTVAEAEFVYDTLRGVGECVESLGYQVHPAPSKQAFVEQLMLDPIPVWHPYDAVFEDGEPADARHARQECPVP